MTTFKIDDRVILTRGFIPMLEYPVWGSRFASIGTVYAIMGDRVHVTWDNGKKQSYNPFSLGIYNTLPPTDPNQAFRSRKLGLPDWSIKGK